jgi:hypothetical protein
MTLPTKVKFTGRVEMQQDGIVKLYTVPTVAGADPGGHYKAYNRFARSDWYLLFYNHQISDPGRLVWMNESWMEGRYLANIWEVKDHGDNDSKHLCQIEMGFNDRGSSIIFPSQYHSLRVQ